MSEETQVALEATEKTEIATEEAQTSEVKEKPQAKKSSGVKLATYFPEAKVVCACGNKFTTGSTKEEIRVEICNNCHPFFTGQEKFVDTEGRVERFKRMEEAKKETKPKKEVEKKNEQPKTLKEMLMSMNK